MKKLIYLFLFFASTMVGAHNISGSIHTHKTSGSESLASLEGRVTDKTGGNPMIFADVAIYQKGILITGTQTDFEGLYSIANLKPGKYDVQSTYVGFSPKKIEGVVLEAGRVTHLYIHLAEGIQLECVQIVEYRVPLIEMDNTSSGGTITSSEMRNLPTKNINALASMTAGISKKKGGHIKARGSRTSGTEYYLDGVRVQGSMQAETTPAESTRVAKSPINTQAQLANKLTATEVNDFSDWGFWSTIQETDFISHSLSWKMNPLNRYSIQVKNNEGFALSGLTAELLDEDGNISWSAQTDNMGRSDLFHDFIESDNNVAAKLIRIRDKNGILKELKAEVFIDHVQGITVDKSCQSSDIIELVFMMDISGSMSDEMAYLRSEMSSVIERISAQFPERVLRVGVVYFEGHGNSTPIHFHQLTDDIDHLNHFIHAQRSGGGSDEAIDLALQTTVDKMEWNERSTKIAFLIGDEELNNVYENRERQRQYTKRCANSGIKLVPIGCSGMPKSLEYVMRTMAIATGGTYLALTDDSGVGNGHIKPTASKIDVKSLNNLLVDVIVRYASYTSCDATNLLSPELSIIPPHENLNKKHVQENKADMVKVFPNPTSGIFNLKQKGHANIKEAFLTDFAGRIVSRLDVKEKEFDISTLATGTYFLLYKTSKGVFGSQQLMKISGASVYANNAY